MKRNMILVRTAERLSPMSQLRPVGKIMSLLLEREEQYDSPRMIVPAPVIRDVSSAS